MIVLDFDRVVFDVERYRVECAARGVTDRNFTPAIWDTLSPAAFLYPDALEFLARHAAESLLILSAATPAAGPEAVAFQERKLRDAQIAQQVAAVVVMQGDKGQLLFERFGAEPFVFIDDKLAHLRSASALCPQARCVQMIRPGGGAEGGERSDDPEIPVVPSFAAVDAIIEKL